MGLRVASLFMLWLALSYANEIRKGRTRNHGHYVCSTWGNNHFKTFDGDIYQFPGICEYNFASDCRDPYKEFSVHIQRALDSNDHPKIQYILVTIKDLMIYLRQKLAVVDGQIVKTPYYSSGVLIESNDIYIKVYAKLGLVVIWNQEDALMVEVDSKFNNRMCGLCGDYNGVPIYNEFINGVASYNSITYGNLQKIHKPNAKCEDPDETQALPSCNGHRGECEWLLTSSAFADCRLRLNLEMYIQACMQDKCACKGHEDSFCLCSTISEYSRQCSHAGGRPGEWRTQYFCPKTCPDTMIYKESSSPCMDTCSHLETSSLCEEHYMDGCFCPEGTVYDDITEKGCIPASQCHCKLHGKEYSPGQSITNECEECTCDSGRWMCKDLPCPGTCSLEGGSHFTTFDGKKYTFHGDCYYVLAKGTVNDTHALLAELGPCGSTDRQTCLKTVVLLVDHKKNVVVFRPDGSVLLNGMTVNVPHVTASFSVFKPTSYYVVVQTSYGLQLQIQLFPVMQLFVTVDQSVQGKLQGLCGNFNGVEGDDFKTTSGLVEATGSAFANTWKAQSTCTDQVEKLEDPCSLSIESANYAEHWCSLLKNSEGPFAKCHVIIDPSEYYKKCKYDTCLCEDSEKCLCAALSSYSRACAFKGVILGGWRKSVCSNEVSACPGNQIFLYNLTMCQQTCRSLADGEKHCLQDFAPVDGCGCPYNTYLDNQDTCVPISKCPCYHKGSYLAPGEYVTKDGERCVCRNAKVQCTSVTIRMKSAMECSSNKTYFDCNTSPKWMLRMPVQLSCHTPRTDHFQEECVSACVCPEGLLDDGKGGCVEQKDCPCSHNNQWYSPGQNITVDCNTCTCQKGVWKCTEEVCYGTCMIYGSGHYITFDGKFFDFDGTCDYVATQDFCGDKNSSGSFSIITENVPCGTTGVTCSKAIKIFLGKTELKLEDKDYKEIQRDIGGDVRYWNRTVGLYLVIEASNGVMLIWDKKTTVFIKLTPDYKGKVCGLCGNFDDKSNNDFTTRSGLQETNALKFGNSWKQSPTCSDVTQEIKPCDVKPHRKSWAEKECSIIRSEVFQICHFKVDPNPFYEACVHDACSCDSGGDCECFCSAVAAYAQECTKAQACVFWRTPDICPIFCDYYNPRNECDWHYEPCGSNVMTCRMINNVSTNFSVPYLEGCYPRCPKDKPIYNEETKECVPEDQCWCYINGTPGPDGTPGTSVPPGTEIPTEENCTKCVCGPSGSIQCTPIPGCPCVINGTSYQVGEIVAQTQNGSICITYICAENGSIEVDTTYPCPTSTSPTTISTSFPTSTLTTTVTSTSSPVTTAPCFGSMCYWTEWFDVSKPDKDGGDYETYEAIRNEHGDKICEAPKKIQCRAKNQPDISLEELGQKVECNVTYGLICKNEDQDPTLWELCYNYEIRVNCCEWYEFPCKNTSTITSTPTATSTTTSTTVLITTTTRQTTSITTTPIPTPTITSELTPPTPTTASTSVPTPTPSQPPSSTTTMPPTSTTSMTTTTVPGTPTPTPTTASTSVPTPTPSQTPSNCDCIWTDWIDVSYPDSSDRNSGDYETFENIQKNDPSWVCAKPENIYCRAKNFPDTPIAELGQTVHCHIDKGLICNNSDQKIGGRIQMPYCLNYEIKVCCVPNMPECMTTTPMSTTTTTSVPTTTSVSSQPVSTTVPTPTPSQPPSSTATTTMPPTSTTSSTSATTTTVPGTPTSTPTTASTSVPTPTPSQTPSSTVTTTMPPTGTTSMTTTSVPGTPTSTPTTASTSVPTPTPSQTPSSTVTTTMPPTGTTGTTSAITTTVPGTPTSTPTTASTSVPTPTPSQTPSSTTMTTTHPPSTTTTTTVPGTPTSTPTTASTSVPTLPPSSSSPIPQDCDCIWTDWIDVSYPDSSDRNSGDYETFENIQKNDPSWVCAKPENIYCRAKNFPDTPIAELGQTVHCHIDKGLICNNSDQKIGGQIQMPYCLNYEIKVCCVPNMPECMTTTPMSTTTTTSVPTTTSVSSQPVSTTVPTPTPSQPPSSTATTTMPPTITTSSTSATTTTVPGTPTSTPTTSSTSVPTPTPSQTPSSTVTTTMPPTGTTSMTTTSVPGTPTSTPTTASTSVPTPTPSQTPSSTATTSMPPTSTTSSTSATTTTVPGTPTSTPTTASTSVPTPTPSQTPSSTATTTMPPTSTTGTTSVTTTTVPGTPTSTPTTASTSVPTPTPSQTPSSTVTTTMPPTGTTGTTSAITTTVPGTPTSTPTTASTSVPTPTPSQTPSSTVTTTMPPTGTTGTTSAITTTVPGTPTPTPTTASTSVPTPTPSQTPSSTVTTTMPPTSTTSMTTTTVPGTPTSTPTTASTSVPTPTPSQTPSSTTMTTTHPPSTTTTTTVPGTPTSTPTTASTSVPTLPPSSSSPIPQDCDCIWTDWIDVSYPDSSDRNSGDYETFENIQKNDPSWVCAKPENIYCRAKNFPDTPIAELGQTVHCHIDKGLICNNSDQKIGGQIQMPYCLNYEIKVCCVPNMPECMTTTPMSTTTTTSVPTTTSVSSQPVSTTVPTPTPSQPPSSTATTTMPPTITTSSTSATTTTVPGTPTPTPTTASTSVPTPTPSQTPSSTVTTTMPPTGTTSMTTTSVPGTPTSTPTTASTSMPTPTPSQTPSSTVTTTMPPTSTTGSTSAITTTVPGTPTSTATTASTSVPTPTLSQTPSSTATTTMPPTNTTSTTSATPTTVPGTPTSTPTTASTSVPTPTPSQTPSSTVTTTMPPTGTTSMTTTSVPGTPTSTPTTASTSVPTPTLSQTPSSTFTTTMPPTSTTSAITTTVPGTPTSTATTASTSVPTPTPSQTPSSTVTTTMPPTNTTSVTPTSVPGTPTSTPATASTFSTPAIITKIPQPTTEELRGSTAVTTTMTSGPSSLESTASTIVSLLSVSTSPVSVTTSGTTPTESFTTTSGTTSSNFTTITATTTTSEIVSSGSTSTSGPTATSSAVTFAGSSTYSTPVSSSSSTTSPSPTTPGRNCSVLPNESYAPGESWWLCNCTMAICVQDDIVKVVPIICNPPPKPTCANGLSPVRVIDKDGCCWHWECDCYCTGWGDPHYMTFDGLYYSYQGNCTYVLVEEINKTVDNFGVYIDNYHCDTRDVVSCPRTLIVRHETLEVRIATVKPNTIPLQVTVNKQAVALPYKKFGLTIYESGINRVVEIPELKMNVTYNGLSFSIRMPYSLFGNNTHGQCGTCNNNTADDCMLPDGNIAENCETMADHWQVVDPSKPQCTPGLIPTKPPGIIPGSCKESAICKLLLGSVFKPCHDVVHPEKYYAACFFDSCAVPDSDLECSSLQIYAATCADQNVCIDWRSHTNGVCCTYKCPSDKEYRACGPIKEITCKSSQQNETSTKQVEGCFCPNGTMLYDSGVDVCVKTCGCVGVDNVPREFGEKFTVDCKDCICLEGGSGILCEPHACAKQNKTSCDGEGFYEVNEVNSDDPCCPIATCKCNTSLCTTKAIKCTMGFEVHSHIPSGQCCPVYQCVPKRVCVHQNAEFLPNSSVFVDKCQNCFCTNEVNVSTQLNIISCEHIPCNTYCQPGYERQPVKGECCGRCVQTKCVIHTANSSDLILKPGEFKNDPYNNCTIYSCVNIHNQFISSVSEITCPAFNEDRCKPGTVTFLPNGCCKTCAPLDSHTACSVRQRKDFIVYNGCRSVDRVIMTECEGTCGTFSQYSAEANSMEHSCSCCRESSTTVRDVELKCPTGHSISHKYIYVESCSCHDTECSSQSNELQNTEENDKVSTLNRIKRAISLTSK
ncbi:mucin-2 [Phalacrocorax carbo]